MNKLFLILIFPSIAALALLSGCSRRPDNLVHVSGNIELTQVDMSFKSTGKLDRTPLRRRRHR